MRTNLDFSPFYRSSIGFDRIFNLLENASPAAKRRQLAALRHRQA